MRIRVDHALDRFTAADLYHQLVSGTPDQTVALELTDSCRPDTVAQAAIVAAARTIARRGGALHIEGSENLARAVERRLDVAPTPAAEPPEQGLGAHAYAELAGARALAVTVVDTITAVARLAVRRAHLPRGAWLDQMTTMGADGVGIVSLLAALLGMILAFEATEQLGELGATVLVADVVGLSLVREFAPLLTAIVVVGRSGAAVASELASMTVDQEVDALRTMGIAPTSFLVLPRLLALAVIQPALTLIATFVGLLGGLLTTRAVADVSTVTFYHRLVVAVDLTDIGYGLEKALAFSVATGFISCAVGLNTRGGAVEVGRATTRAVVLSIFMLVVIDSVFALTSGTVTL